MSPMSTFDPTKPCQLRDGRKVRELATFAPLENGRTILAISERGEIIGFYFPSGKAFNTHSDLPHDLINIPEKRTISAWAVINADGDVLRVTKEEPCDPMFAAAGRKVVELTKEVEL